MLQRQNLYCAKTKFTCCKDNIYIYICYKDKFICYKDKIYMRRRQNIYVVKTKNHGARAERARRGFFLPEKAFLFFENAM